jgi:hypothetical protein
MPAYSEPDVSDKPPYVRNSYLSSTGSTAPDVRPCCAFNQYPDIDTRRERRRDQLRTLRSVDDAIGQLFQVPGAADDGNTLSLFTSDNGYLWNENYIEGKLTPYTYSLRVPFYMRWPGTIAAGGNEPRLVSNVDIAPTVMGAVGLLASTDPAVPMDGRSLLEPGWTHRYLLSEYSRGPDPDTSDTKAACELPSWNALRAAHWQYTRYDAIASEANPDSSCNPDNGHDPPGYWAPPFREFYGKETGTFNDLNDIMQMQDNAYGGDGTFGTADDLPGATPPKDAELTDALNCKGQGQIPGHPACP